MRNCIVEFIDPKDPALCKHCLREYEDLAEIWELAGKGEL
jgi:hypothetical protein